MFESRVKTEIGSADRRSLLKGVAALGITFGTVSGCGHKSAAEAIAPTGEARSLNFYNWDTYIGHTTLADFTRASGIAVNFSIMETNDALFQKLVGGNPGYDVIVPSGDVLTRLIQKDFIQPLDHRALPNFRNIASEFRDAPFDPGRRFSMPYAWFLLGIGFRKSKVKTPPTSWRTLFDSPEYRGRIALSSDSGDVFRLAANYLGKSSNAMTPDTIAQVEQMLKRQRPHIKTFHGDDGQDLLEAGEVDLVLEYNGDMLQLMARDADIGFVIPDEGSLINSDNLCIPKGAPHPRNAHAFINYLLDAEIGRGIVEATQYATPNAAAKALMPESYRKDPLIFPSPGVLAKCQQPTFDAQAQPEIERAFARVQAG